MEKTKEDQKSLDRLNEIRSLLKDAEDTIRIDSKYLDTDGNSHKVFYRGISVISNKLFELVIFQKIL